MPYKEALLEIYKIEYSKYEKTRGIQWKMNIAIWTLISALAYATAKGDIGALKNHLPWCITIIAGLLSACICIVHAIFLSRIQLSLNNSMTRLENIASYLCNKSLLEDSAKEERLLWESIEEGTKIKMKGWVFLQTFVSVILVATAWIVNIHY